MQKVVCSCVMRATFFLVVLLAVSGLLRPSATAGPVELGDAPSAPTPEQVERLRQRGPIVMGPGDPYSVNITSREEVRSFFNTVYQSSENFSIGWTGDLTTCTPGGTDAGFRGQVARRINYFRAMAGIPAGVTLDDALGAKDQQAALMMSANNALSHYPPNSWICFSQDGYDAAGNSNLALGNAGPDAITAYIDDFGGNNYLVGHRRWILYPQTQIMATGDVDETPPYREANATWIIDGNFGGPRPTVRDGFVSWPPPGYVPYRVVFPRWSISYPNANFMNATVTMSSNGVNLSVTREIVQNGAGENTLVWYPTGLDTANPYAWPKPAADTVYTVNVQNVSGGGAPASFNYSVTVFDPQVPGPDTVVPVISGPDQPAVGAPNNYTFTTVPNATSHQWRQAQRAVFNAVEGAESGLAGFATQTTPDYNVVVANPKASGASAFHLAHTQPDPQILTCTRVFLTGTNSQMQFKSRLGYASDVETATVQISFDGGSSWQDVYTQVGTGVPGETTFSTRTISLSTWTNREFAVRFKYEVGIGPYYNAADLGYGWYIDDISFTNVEELTNPAVTDVATGASFAFTPALLTNYVLNVRAQVYDEFPLEWGPAKRVVPSNVVVVPVVSVATPVISGGEVSIEFDVVNPTPNLIWQLLTTADAADTWSLDSAATLQVVTPNARYRFTTPLTGAPERFYRVRAN